MRKLRFFGPGRAVITLGTNRWPETAGVSRLVRLVGNGLAIATHRTFFNTCLTVSHTTTQFNKKKKMLNTKNPFEEYNLRNMR